MLSLIAKSLSDIDANYTLLDWWRQTLYPKTEERTHEVLIKQKSQTAKIASSLLKF